MFGQLHSSTLRVTTLLYSTVFSLCCPPPSILSFSLFSLPVCSDADIYTMTQANGETEYRALLYKSMTVDYRRGFNKKKKKKKKKEKRRRRRKEKKNSKFD